MEAGTPRAAGRPAAHPVLHHRDRVRAGDDVARDVESGSPGGRLGAVLSGAMPRSRTRSLVLRGQARVPLGPDVHLPALEDRRHRLVAMALPAGSRRRGRRALGSAGTPRRSPARGGDLLRPHARPGARLRRRVPVPLLVRRRPLPVPGEHRAGHPARSPRDPGRRPAARSRLRGCRRASRDAGRLHLAPGRHLREPGNPLARHGRQESRRRPRAQ